VISKRPDLSVTIAGMRWDNPLTTASGTMGGWENYAKIVPFDAYGAITIKSVSPEPRPGNAPPRLAETPCGMLNSVGLQNPGIDDFLIGELPKIRRLNRPMIVSVAGKSISDYCVVAERLTGQEGVFALELNMSCPNTDRETMEFGQSAEEAYRLVKAVRDVTDLPIIPKVTPNIADPVAPAKAMVEAGACALAVANTLLAMSIDIRSKLPKTGTLFAGLSGPAIRPVIVRMVWQITDALPGVPVIAMGGASTWADCVEYFLAGASAVALGTVNFVNHRAATDILTGLEAYLTQNGYSSVQELIGQSKDAWQNRSTAERLHS
jgi:dihydroorotate dehydrogenase (NAD+) catalytic subunit